MSELLQLESQWCVLTALSTVLTRSRVVLQGMAVNSGLFLSSVSLFTPQQLNWRERERWGRGGCVCEGSSM